MIETTRPELIPACVALVAHPDDARYQPLFGTEVTTPLFGVKVPVRAHPLADPEKGSGIAMICTFGDTADVTWWRELDLPARSIVGWDGRLLADAPALGGEVWSDAALDAYASLAGKTVKQAQQKIVELLRESGDLVGDPKPITHAVKFYEKGDRPLEIVTTRQWYLTQWRKGSGSRGRASSAWWRAQLAPAAHEGALRALGRRPQRRLVDQPPALLRRAVPGLVPPRRATGDPDYDARLIPTEAELPVDPSSDVPTGFTEDQRGKAGGFMGDPDVMDTWATSSLTPQIACGWEVDPDLFARTFPMDLRPQGPEIIRTWLFDTVVRSHLEHDELPWNDTTINGWILDPDRKKMSKSKGNDSVTPMTLLEQYGSDAVRYWAVSARPGVDTAFDEGQMKIGRRLSIKLLNASKFVLGVMGDDDIPAPDAIRVPLDQSLLEHLHALIGDATRAFDGYDYARALELTERFFWSFCDDYLELVKQRAYGAMGHEPARSAQATLAFTLDALLRLFAPHLPFVTEEVWSWWRTGSVHHAAWPSVGELPAISTPGRVFELAADTLGAIRKEKSTAQRSMRTEVTSLVVRAPADELASLDAAVDDLREAGCVVGAVELVAGDEFAVEVDLVAPEPA